MQPALSRLAQLWDGLRRLHFELQFTKRQFVGTWDLRRDAISGAILGAALTLDRAHEFCRPHQRNLPAPQRSERHLSGRR